MHIRELMWIMGFRGPHSALRLQTTKISNEERVLWDEIKTLGFPEPGEPFLQV